MAQIWIGADKKVDQSETDEVFINAAGTGAGVVAHIPDNGILLVYSSRAEKSLRIQSDLVRADMVLHDLDGKIVFFDGDVAYRFSCAQGTPDNVRWPREAEGRL